MANSKLQTALSRVLKQDTGDYIVFRNEINSFELPTEVIVRRRTVKIGFYCRFPKILSISSFYTLHQSDYIFTESSFGSFSFSFEIYSDNSFTDKVNASSYPVQVKLLDTIYLGIQAQSEMPNVKLFVESCRGTPDDNTNNAIFYDLVKDGLVLFFFLTFVPFPLQILCAEDDFSHPSSGV